MTDLVFEKGTVPQYIELEGIRVKVKSVRPWWSRLFRERKEYEKVNKVECPACGKDKYADGFFLHIVAQTRNSDSGHAKLYLKIHDHRGTGVKARESMKKWADRHRRSMAMLNRMSAG